MSEDSKPLYARLAAVSLNRAKKSVWANYQPEQSPSETVPTPPIYENTSPNEGNTTQNSRYLQPVSEAEPVSDKEPVTNSLHPAVSEPVPYQIPASKTVPLPDQVPALDLVEGSPIGKDILPLRKEPVVNQLPDTKEVPVRFLQENAAHLRFPYEVLDKILFELKPGPHVILERLYRLSAGWDKDICRISIPKLASTCKVGLTQTRQYLKELELKGYITRLGEDVTNPNVEIRGIDIRVNLPRMPPPKKRAGYGTTTGLQKETGSESEPNKDKNFKEQSHTNTQGQHPDASSENLKIDKAAVSVNSRFGLAECKLYADHLHKTGQGIVNPGGYATTIYRTGEADPLINLFLNPVSDQIKNPTVECPDCQGTGFWYPEGFEKGAAKCRHEKLA